MRHGKNDVAMPALYRRRPTAILVDRVSASHSRNQFASEVRELAVKTQVYGGLPPPGTRYRGRSRYAVLCQIKCAFAACYVVMRSGNGRGGVGDQARQPAGNAGIQGVW